MNSTSRVVRQGCLAFFAVLLTLLSFSAASQAADRAFASRFSTNDTGDILAIGNTVETCAAGTSSSQAPTTLCSTAQNAPAATTANNGIINNSFNMVYVDTDGDSSTFNSSSSTLAFPNPANAQVLFAGLYWGGEVTAGTGGAAAPNAAARNTVKFKTPGGSYQTITASQVDDGAIIYQGFADVTALVAAAGAGQYTLGNLQTGTGADRLGGWSLVIAYRDTSQPARNLTVFDGLQSVNGSTGATIPVSGFLTPPTGPVKTELGFITYEGDAGLVGDAASLNNVTLSDNTHPANNFFNSHISRNGVDQTNKNPDYDNQLGFDISYVNADNILGNSATSATIRTTTSGDVYAPGVITFATEVYAPKITQTKSVSDDNGGVVEQGDTLTYTISGTNTGDDGTSGFILRDPIPANTSYLPGSLKVSPEAGGAATETATDASTDDRGEYDSATNRIVARLGVGSTATVGGNVKKNQTYTVTFKVRVNSAQTLTPAQPASAQFPVPNNTVITNTATANYFSQTTGIPLTNSSTATTTVKAPDLALTKSRVTPAPPAPIVAGSPVTYKLHVANVGGAPTQGQYKVVDTLPAGLTIASFGTNPGWTCTGTGTANLECTRSDVLTAGTGTEAGTFSDITFTASVASGTQGDVTNTAVVSGGGDGNPANNTSKDTSPSDRVADLSIVKSASAATVNIGDNVVFTFVVKNIGPSDATSVAVSDALPGEFSYVGNDSNCVYTPQTGTIGCTIGDLAAGAAKTIKVTAKAKPNGAAKTIANTATVSSQQTDPTPGNNSSTVNVAITGVDLQIVKTLDPANQTLTPGGPVTYKLTYKNNGPSDATAVVVKDMLGAGLQAISSTTPGCTAADPELSCAVGNVAAGASGTIAVSAVVKAGATQVTNNAAIAGAETDPDLTNNATTITSPVTQAADVSIVKTGPAIVAANGNLTYTLTVKNNGPAAAADVTATDVLPGGVTYVSSTGGCTEATGTVTCAIGTLASGATATRTITVKATQTSGSIANTAKVTSTTPDPDPTNNTSTVTTAINASADVQIKKTASPATVVGGDTVTYTLTATNNGSADADNVKVSDTLPAGVTFVSVDDTTNCTQAAGTVNCTFPTIAAGDSKVIVIKATANSIGTVDNGATHQLNDGKVEQSFSLQPGETKTVTVDCNQAGPGYIVTDGAARFDAVDQGTGTPADARILSAQATGVSTYAAVIRNTSTGQVQGHVFANCLSPTTSTDDGHSHNVIVSAPVTTTQTVGAGEYTATLECGPGRTPIQPGYDFGLALATVQASKPSAGGTGWVFRYVMAEGGTATFSIRCLDNMLSSAGGHTPTLNLRRITQDFTVQPGQTLDVELSCGDDEKGIVGDWDIPAGLLALGNDPRPKTRNFRFYNSTNAPLSGTIGLLCLAMHTGPSQATSTVTNVATISSDTTDPNPSNNSASANITVGLNPAPPAPPVVPPPPPPAPRPTTATTADPGTSSTVSNGIAAVTGTPTTTTDRVSGRALFATTPAKVTGTTAAFVVSCAKGGPTCVGTILVKASAKAKAVVAKVSYAVKAGTRKSIKVKASSLKRLKKVTVAVVGRDGRKVVRTVKLSHR